MIKMQQGVHERMQALSAVRKSQDEVKAQIINMQFA
jgi:hypothetical protein